MLCILTPRWPCQNTTIFYRGTTPSITLRERWWLALAHLISERCLGNSALVGGTSRNNSQRTRIWLIQAGGEFFFAWQMAGNACSWEPMAAEDDSHLMTQEPWSFPEQWTGLRHLADITSNEEESLFRTPPKQVIFAWGKKILPRTISAQAARLGRLGWAR